MAGQFPGMSELFFMVYRNVTASNCCVPFFGRPGFDGMSGFEVRWPDRTRQMPENNAWVEVTGVLNQHGNRSLYIELISLRELDRRGMEFIY